jgi:methionyl-tRNA formyltransferase
MAKRLKILFFGSTADSVIVLQKIADAGVEAVITQPPRAIGRRNIPVSTPVQQWAEARSIPVAAFPTHPEKPWLYADPDHVRDNLLTLHADLIISASYGQKIPSEIITAASNGGLNVHPSLLPRWRGGDPVPWAILAGDTETGVSVVTLGTAFDAGRIVAQERVSIVETDTSAPLRSTLFTVGAELLSHRLKDIGRYPPENISFPQDSSDPEPVSRRFTRDDGYLPWEVLKKARNGESALAIGEYGYQAPIIADYVRIKPDLSQERSLAAVLHRFFRALHPWPGIWSKLSINNSELRIKILACRLSEDNMTLIIDSVQLEGKKPVPYAQFVQAYGQTAFSS